MNSFDIVLITVLLIAIGAALYFYFSEKNTCTNLSLLSEPGFETHFLQGLFLSLRWCRRQPKQYTKGSAPVKPGKQFF